MRVLRSLVASRRRLFASIAALGAVTIAAVGGTYANFTATPLTIPGNAITTGTLALQRSGTGAVLTAQGVKVGQTVDGSVTITNTGTLTGTFTLTGALEGGSDATVADQLRLVVYEDTDGSGTPLYDGAFSAFGSAGLGTFGPGASHTFFFHATLNSRGSDALDNAMQGKTASQAFTWSGTQA
jgi:spore coat-associated protein N